VLKKVLGQIENLTLSIELTYFIHKGEFNTKINLRNSFRNTLIAALDRSP